MNVGSTSSSTSHRPVGRAPGPLDDTISKLLPAAFELFLTEGGSALTPTRLHDATGISRATVYRNWPDPADLIELMLQHVSSHVDFTPTGDTRVDLYRAVDGICHVFATRPVRAFFAACIEYGRRSDRMAVAAGQFIDGQLGPIRVVVTRGVNEGELAGKVDDLVAEIAGPLVLRHVVMGETVSKAQGRVVVDHFLACHS